MYCLKGRFLNQWPFFKGGKRGKPPMTTSAVTARRKGDPQHMLRENNFSAVNKNGAVTVTLHARNIKKLIKHIKIVVCILGGISVLLFLHKGTI